MFNYYCISALSSGIEASRSQELCFIHQYIPWNPAWHRVIDFFFLTGWNSRVVSKWMKCQIRNLAQQYYFSWMCCLSWMARARGRKRFSRGAQMPLRVPLGGSNLLQEANKVIFFLTSLFSYSSSPGEVSELFFPFFLFFSFPFPISFSFPFLFPFFLPFKFMEIRWEKKIEWEPYWTSPPDTQSL